MSSQSTVDITLQGREYRVACAPEEREALLAAVTHVETKMGEIAVRTKSSGERLAVMTALNLAHELLNKSNAPQTSAPAEPDSTAGFDKPEIGRRIEAMVARLDAAMTQQASLL